LGASEPSNLGKLVAPLKPSFAYVRLTTLGVRELLTRRLVPRRLGCASVAAARRGKT